MNTANLYEIRLINRFWNGHHHMVEIRGVCRPDGQSVRYHQPWDYWLLRVELYRSEHPGIETADAMMAAASMALDQSRRSWLRSKATE